MNIKARKETGLDAESILKRAVGSFVYRPIDVHIVPYDVKPVNNDWNDGCEFSIVHSAIKSHTMTYSEVIEVLRGLYAKGFVCAQKTSFVKWKFTLLFINPVTHDRIEYTFKFV